MPNNNETIGQSAESAICKLSGISCEINAKRINNAIENRIVKNKDVIESIKKIKIISSEGYKNGKVDFKLKDGKTLSLKTLKKEDGKICPQTVGQPTLKSFDKWWNKEEEFGGFLYNNPKRFNFIKKNIHEYLNTMLEYLYCCDYLLLISNCSKDNLIAEFLDTKKNYFIKQEIKFTRELYEEAYNTKKKKNSEFSTTIKMLYEENNKKQEISIGELQFHNKSRKQVKFRFHKKFIKFIQTNDINAD